MLHPCIQATPNSSIAAAEAEKPISFDADGPIEARRRLYFDILRRALASKQGVFQSPQTISCCSSNSGLYTLTCVSMFPVCARVVLLIKSDLIW